jgi:hypothetical protein
MLNLEILGFIEYGWFHAGGWAVGEGLAFLGLK